MFSDNFSVTLGSDVEQIHLGVSLTPNLSEIFSLSAPISLITDYKIALIIRPVIAKRQADSIVSVFEDFIIHTTRFNIPICFAF